ncbi:2Fe-2S iron-sulfur cluster-binding protein [Sporosarcina globispora]|uniref:2Fe-2S iron-sulfur cluster-binding protein n=1 Tax=Sporosarcina globispora TaxID=1459 RepID=UPI0006A96091|nr:2Fe-2S iron-sulfur cluster-binding protein [Sporosarcina globispora]
MDKRIFTVGSLIPGNIVNIEAINSNLIDAESIPVAHQLQKIGLVQNQNKLEIQPIKGKLLLDAALQQGQDLKFKCRKGTCGVCTVKIEEGASHLHPPNDKEKKKLKMALNQGYRLACQSMIQ